MAVLTVQNIVAAGLNPSYAAAAAGGDTFANDGRTLFHVKNAHSAAWTVTIAAARACNFGTLHNGGGSVPNADDIFFGPFPPERFGETVSVTYSGVTALTVAALSMVS